MNNRCLKKLPKRNKMLSFYLINPLNPSQEYSKRFVSILQEERHLFQIFLKDKSFLIDQNPSKR